MDGDVKAAIRHVVRFRDGSWQIGGGGRLLAGFASKGEALRLLGESGVDYATVMLVDDDA